MPPPAMLAFEDGLENEWKGFTVFPGENPSPNPNYNFLVKKAVLESEKPTGSSSARDDSFRIVLPPAMPPPRDSAVPLPTLPEPMRVHKKLGRQEACHFMRRSRVHSSEEMNVYKEEDFKCNAFCLTLPGFGGKHKTVRSSSRGRDSMEKKMMSASSFTYSTVSINASLEKFECSSWASTTVLTQDHGRMYFDFPVEMMKRGNGGRDVQEPVTSGFLFDRETETMALRSVLKTRSSRSSGRDHQRSAETSPLRRVRFSDSSSGSVSCPTSPRSCISPRLRQARDDFNTFLSAQNA